MVHCEPLLSCFSLSQETGGGGEAGRSQGGAGFPKGATANSGNDKTSGSSGKSN